VPDRSLHPLSTGHGEAHNAVFNGAQAVDASVSDLRRDRGEHSGWIAAADDDQFNRDIAAIERASVALRRAEPALRSWAEPPPSLNSPHPLWLIIGTLWVSTALVALSAVFAVYVLAN
jgi:hypothetical protein